MNEAFGCPENVKSTYDINMPLERLLEEMFGNSSTKIIRALDILCITKVEHLTKLSDDNWKIIEQRLPAHCLVLKTATDNLNYVSIGRSNAQSLNRSVAEQLSDWHKVELFLHYTAKRDSYQDFGYLNNHALELGFEEQIDDKSFDMGPNAQKIKALLKEYTTPKKLDYMRKKSYGMILYGPPGTGKTELSKILIKRAGLAKIVEPLSSTEVNRSLVGETEKLLMAIFKRALYCPYLLCCIAIDEVDALTPKRNDKSASHKVDCTFFIVIINWRY